MAKPLSERTLRGFFLGEMKVTDLRREVIGCAEQIDQIRQNVHIRRDLSGDFELTRACLLKLCDATLEGALPPEALTTIAFIFQATDHFIWDGDKDDVLANIIDDWSAPQINYPLTEANLKRFRKWLLGNEPYPSRAAVSANQSGGQLIFERYAQYHS